MSYSDALDDRGKSILTQVAFKAAVDLNPQASLADEADQAAFVAEFSFLTEVLIDAVKSVVNAPGTSGSTAPSGAEVIHANFPGTTEETFSVKVRGQQHGPFPEWFLTEAAAKGITEVYDNRDQLAENPKRPWFRSTSNKDDAFWPPRKGR
jgi:hypothetical protein